MIYQVYVRIQRYLTQLANMSFDLLIESFLVHGTAGACIFLFSGFQHKCVCVCVLHVMVTFAPIYIQPKSKAKAGRYHLFFTIIQPSYYRRIISCSCE